MPEVDYQCRRCGSTLSWEDCATCVACGDLNPHTGYGAQHCTICEGSGRMPVCLSSEDYCRDNPLPGRDLVQRHDPEEFEVAASPAEVQP